ncbi:MAG: 3alpha(or 20beta)-hydroxysteroid dehydrogenase [Acidimicrobiales bacterium]|jgi:3alpha(or 20beta)-hydroxysteroid dehydrogenase
MPDMSNRVVIITGGARGQGASEGQLFVDAGATVVLTDVLDDAGEKTAGEIGADFLHHDVSSEADWTSMVDDVIARHGRIDALVNNAGILHASRLVNYQLEDWNRVIAINQTGVFLGMRAVAPAMIEQGAGSIVNISSVAGLEGVFGSMAYSASKFAVRGMTKVAAKELSPSNVRVNSVHPGIINTDMTADFPKERMLRAVPLGREADPAEVGRMVLFLASDDSSYCTGQEFIVDGGMHA